MQKEKTDLPHRRAELASAEENLRRLAEELEWKADAVETLVKRISAAYEGYRPSHAPKLPRRARVRRYECEGRH